VDRAIIMTRSDWDILERVAKQGVGDRVCRDGVVVLSICNTRVETATKIRSKNGYLNDPD
jgi:hypothetical protein